MTIESSAANDPIRNISVLMPGAESTYETQPFNSVWLEKLLTFRSVRFMDWFATNSWGQTAPWDWDYPERFEWTERQQLNNYTWTNGKGIPYEMAVKLLNDYDLDGWICVPHRANDDFIRQMAQLFHNTVEPERTLTVEYSNETWNWIFGQAQWLNKYGCVNTGTPWPEGTVPYIQNCLDIWTDVFLDAPERLVRVVGVQTGWQDVSNRTVFNMVPGSLDAFATTYYFGLNDEADAALDALGANATAADIAYWARKSSTTGERQWLLSQKNEISIPLNLPMVFYEGGQHLTPNPFGEEPTYAQALLDIQRDTAMYNLYNEQYDFIRTLQSGDKPLQLMNFSFISSRSARYGSWGLLETMDQDLDQIPAPKYQATLENMANCITVSTIQAAATIEGIRVFPNPTCNAIQMSFAHDLVADVSLLTASGTFVAKQAVSGATTIRFEMKDLESGVYWVVVQTKGGVIQTYRVVKG